MKKRILKKLWIFFELELLKQNLINLLRKDIDIAKREALQDMKMLENSVNSYNKSAQNIYDIYNSLHKKFKSWIDINTISGSWAIIAFRQNNQDIIKFYELRNWKEVSDFIEINKYNNPHIDKPMWYSNFIYKK